MHTKEGTTKFINMMPNLRAQIPKGQVLITIEYVAYRWLHPETINCFNMLMHLVCLELSSTFKP